MRYCSVVMQGESQRTRFHPCGHYSKQPERAAKTLRHSLSCHGFAGPGHADLRYAVLVVCGTGRLRLIFDLTRKGHSMRKNFPSRAFGVVSLLTVSGMVVSGCTAFDRAAGTNTSGVYTAQSDGTPSNPPGTQTTRAFDRAAGTNVSGAYPGQRDGTQANPTGTAAGRAYDRAAGANVSGAYPQNEQVTPRY